ncbi:cytochrome c [Asticcacaulis sp. EMRT-3]|uniref:c-type cytochrome n=1 Tax=Asticcacaulis sp. EMRT-3 TaxID=3040349 RepID=UPI0024AF7F3C|nr:cytochrome c [Asticcacaulis sp. EMRT-3]MDI7776269.1 cytochrome c [Asticcacaulis sp. EMRT-3]
MFRRLLLAAAAFSLVTATAAFADPAAQIKARQAYFHGIGRAMKGLNDTLRTASPSKAEILSYTATISSQAPKLVSFFPAGTGLDSGLKTGAKPDIWQKQAEFKADAEGFNVAAQKLNMVAQGNNQAALKVAMDAVGNACKTCHQTFRKEDH